MKIVNVRSATILALTTIFFAVMLASCRRDEVSEQVTRTVRIMDPVEANNLHVPLAVQKGYFSEAGLDVQVSGTSAGKFAMDAVMAGAVDYAVVVEMNVAQRLFSDADIAILAEIAEPIRAIKVLGRTDHGVLRPADVAGKKIGVLFGVNIHLFITEFLKDHGISEDSVDLVNLRPPDAVAAFSNGDIDVVIAWQPHVWKLQQELGHKVTVLTDDASRFWTYKMVLVTKRSYLNTHREEARKILGAIVRADAFIDEHPDEAKLILAEHIHTPKDAVNQFFEEIQFKVQITPRLVEMIKTEVEWLEATLLRGKKPVTRDYRALIADELLKVKPKAWKLNR